MKYLFFFIITFAAFCSQAQISEVDRMNLENVYFADSSLIFNYSPKNNIVVSYGHYENAPSVDGLFDRSSFFVESIGSGLNHIVSLPVGYKVNDICFVSLKKDSTDEYDVFCCFCGTHWQFKDIYIVSDSLYRTTYYYVYDTMGFVGYFKMDEALNPNASYSATIRDVEGSKELYRMIGYAEENGRYHNFQHTYRDNAVLDVVGIPENTIPALSCLCRVKFYPKFPPGILYGINNGTRWDNNIRYDFASEEIMENIENMDNSLVTISRMNRDDTTIWIRSSQKEIQHVSNGLDLNPYISFLRASNLQINDQFLVNRFYTKFESPIQICKNQGDVFSLAFHVYNNEEPSKGILALNSPWGPSNKYNGALDYVNTGVKDLIYLPYLNVTSCLLHSFDNTIHTASFIYWNDYSNGYYPILHLIDDNYILQSTCRYDCGYDKIQWTGINANQQDPIYLLSQLVLPLVETNISCAKIIEHEAPKASIEFESGFKEFTIKHRYEDLQDDFPISIIPFNPYYVEKEPKCTHFLDQ